MLCREQDVIKLVKRDAPVDDILKVMNHVVEQAKDNEKARSLQEMKIQNRLRALQSEMHRLLRVAKERTEVGPSCLLLGKLSFGRHKSFAPF